ncbi:MAG TPA: hypothetical protein VKM55_25130 [Candidatus Lokiarchaeia archaeon]|nr:hypothetical protein [Candidatus Lokiarchaeia archaeon]
MAAKYGDNPTTMVQFFDGKKHFVKTVEMLSAGMNGGILIVLWNVKEALPKYLQIKDSRKVK